MPQTRKSACNAGRVRQNVNRRLFYTVAKSEQSYICDGRRGGEPAFILGHGQVTVMTDVKTMDQLFIVGNNSPNIGVT